MKKELPTLDSISVEEFNAMMQRAYDQSLKGEGRPFDEVFADIERAEERANREGWISADEAEKKEAKQYFERLDLGE